MNDACCVHYGSLPYPFSCVSNYAFLGRCISASCTPSKTLRAGSHYSTVFTKSNFETLYINRAAMAPVSSKLCCQFLMQNLFTGMKIQSRLLFNIPEINKYIILEKLPKKASRKKSCF